MKPSRLFLVALALSTALFIAAYKARSPTCTTPIPNWLYVLFWIFGPLAVAAVFGGVLIYGSQKGEGGVIDALGTLVLAALIAGVWTLVGLYVIFGLVAGHCLG